MAESEEAGRELYVGHGADVPTGSSVQVAIRPEKVMLSLNEPDVVRNVTKGIVRDIAYLGDVSIYHVSGKIVLATMPNLVRLAERTVTWDDEVYLYWQKTASFWSREVK